MGVLLGVAIYQFGYAQLIQYKYAYTKDIIVIKHGEIIKEPWSGGLNTPQFNAMDVNFDCLDDLILFDRDGQKLRVYINQTNHGGEPIYTYAPEYEIYFPNDISDYLILRDYDQDGKIDIFTNNTPFESNGNGVKVYRNVSDNTLKFELIQKNLSATNGSLATTVFVRPLDFPSIDDIDGDGDLDIITVAQLGLNNYQYYENRSADHKGLDFYVKTGYWGEFFQLNDGTVCLNSECPTSTTPEAQTREKRDGGTSLTTLDLTGNGLKDALIGDPDRQNIIQLTNGGTDTVALMTDVNYHYPDPNGVAVDITSFPSSFYLDINNDHKKDLVVSPNQYLQSIDTANIWWYENESLNDIPDFQLKQTQFLGNQQLDVGTLAIPVFADISGDGLVDLIIGNMGYFQHYDPTTFTTKYKSKLAYYRNTGTTNKAQFEWVTNDLANIGELGLERISPTIADLDNDGDNDLVFGTSPGDMYYYTNIAPLGSEANFVRNNSIFNNQNFGIHASPLLYDINQDDLIDLIVGQKNGHMRLYLNTGSVSDPKYNTTITDTLGDILNYVPGYENDAIPAIGTIDGGSEEILLVGNTSGELLFYSGISTDYLAPYTLIDQMYVSNATIAPALANLNQSDSLELVIGEITGGLLLFDMNSIAYDYRPYPRAICENPDTGIDRPIKSTGQILLYPNPNDGIFTLVLSDEIQNIQGKSIISIIDMTGRIETIDKIIISGTNHKIKMSYGHLGSGMYIVTLEINNEFYHTKLIIY